MIKKVEPFFETFHFFTPKTGKYDINVEENKKIFEIIRKRKFNSDCIFKKIKSRFFKSIKIILKKTVKKLNPKISFKFLSQDFISDINKSNNKSFWNMTLNDFLKYKLKRDNELLKYLENDKKGNIIFKDLFNEYLKSEEFAFSIYLLSKESRISQNYINNYLNKAKNFVNHFSS